MSACSVYLVSSFYFLEGDEGMKTDEKKQREKPQKRKAERLSKREWEDLMGQHEPVYERRRGAIRRKY